MTIPSLAAETAHRDDGLPDPRGLLSVTPAGPGRYVGQTAVLDRPIAYGGQLMAQSIAAAAAHHPLAPVRQLHTVFARAGVAGEPVDLEVEPVRAGRTVASVTVTGTQGDRVLCRSLVLLDAGDRDVVRHQVPLPPVPGPEGLPDAGRAADGSTIRFADPAYDPAGTAADGEPELGVWVRWPALPDDPRVHLSATAWHTDPFVVGTAMRPHEGVGLGQAHRTLQTAVLSHTLTFHSDPRADDWLLVWQRSTHAGSGRVHGHGEVFARDGAHVASFTQLALVREAAPVAGGVR
ncbi:acyl-CoA thioesterase [Pseudonocardia xishanensis]|uniref:Acyl-CoA thioesterase II n=1 Tax=Pseudonocardia xishanensis TaxID=630995 RepID=A0ABP8S1W7_9PSEU